MWKSFRIKRSFCLVLLSLSVCSLMLTVGKTLNAQELPNLKHIKLNKKAHFKDNEGLALKVTDYIFATPIDHKNDSRRQAGQFLIRWMNGTPDYVFFLGEKETTYFDTDTELMLVYMAGLTRFCLQHKSVTDPRQRTLGALQLALPYLDKQENKKRWSVQLWQLMDAYKNGKLAVFLEEEETN